MGTETRIPLDTQPDWLMQEGVTFAFAEGHGAKFRCYEHRPRHGPTAYCGYMKHPIVSPEGFRCFASLILRDANGPTDKKRKTVTRVALFESKCRAKHTAFLWHCQLVGVDVSKARPGCMTWFERRRLIKQLNGTGRLYRMPGPNPILLMDKEKAIDTPDENIPRTRYVDVAQQVLR